MAVFQVYQNKALKVSELLEDAVFGYEEILEQEDRVKEVKALKDSLLYMVPKEQFMKVMENNYEISTQFIKAKNFINQIIRNHQYQSDVLDIQKQKEYQEIVYLKQSKDKVDQIAMKFYLKERNSNLENINNNVDQQVPNYLKHNENKKYLVKYQEKLDKKNKEMKGF